MPITEEQRQDMLDRLQTIVDSPSEEEQLRADLAELAGALGRFVRDVDTRLSALERRAGMTQEMDDIEDVRPRFARLEAALQEFCAAYRDIGQLQAEGARMAFDGGQDNGALTFNVLVGPAPFDADVRQELTDRGLGAIVGQPRMRASKPPDTFTERWTRKWRQRPRPHDVPIVTDQKAAARASSGARRFHDERGTNPIDADVDWKYGKRKAEARI